MSMPRQQVLLVEDSPSFSAVLSEAIQKQHGFSVVSASTCQRARELLADASPFFCAIVDYHLPDAPHGEAVDLVVSSGLPTVVFTGRSGVAMEEELWQKRIADYANKFGRHNIDYVVWMVKRLYLNQSVAVLVVDDSDSARESVRDLLMRQNFIVYCADSGEQALALLKRHSHIRLVVVDCNMPGMSGVELTGKIREFRSRAALEVIGISVQGGRSLAASFIKSGASDLVLKPLIPEEFLSRINNAMDRIDAYFEMERLNKLKNEFLGIAAHDIRGPLGSIKTAAEFLQKRAPTPERRQTLIDIVYNSSVGLLALLEALLDISVIESGKPKLNLARANLSEALRERIDLYQAEARAKGITLRYKIASDITAEVDVLKLKQVFDNLLTNAIKYSAKDSEVSVRLAFANGRVLLNVQDAGPGIAVAEQAQLFKAFSVLSSKTTGGEKKTGLGLVIAKSIVEAHGGSIRYQHDEHCHSTFVVEIPLVCVDQP